MIPVTQFCESISFFFSDLQGFIGNYGFPQKLPQKMLKFSSRATATRIRVTHFWLSTKRAVERWVEERRICIGRSVADLQKCGPRETVVDEDRDAAAVVRATAGGGGGVLGLRSEVAYLVPREISSSAANSQTSWRASLIDPETRLDLALKVAVLFECRQ
jgi:hypothetical protein